MTLNIIRVDDETYLLLRTFKLNINVVIAAKILHTTYHNTIYLQLYKSTVLTAKLASNFTFVSNHCL